MAPKGKGRAPAAAPLEDRNVDKRGVEWQALKLTGARRQKGILPNGAPHWQYEVVWAGVDPTCVLSMCSCVHDT